MGFVPRMPTIAGVWLGPKLGTQSRSPTCLARTQLLKPSPLLPGSALGRSWNPQVDLGVNPGSPETHVSILCWDNWPVSLYSCKCCRAVGYAAARDVSILYVQPFRFYLLPFQHPGRQWPMVQALQPLQSDGARALGCRLTPLWPCWT